MHASVGGKRTAADAAEAGAECTFTTTEPLDTHLGGVPAAAAPGPGACTGGRPRPRPATARCLPPAPSCGKHRTGICVWVGVGGRKQGHARVNVDLAASSCANGAAGPPVCFTLTTDHPCNWGQTMCTALTGLPINSQPAWPGNQTSHACARREALRSRRLLQPLQALLQRRAVQRRAVLGPAGMDGDARAAGAERRLGAMAQHISWE